MGLCQALAHGTRAIDALTGQVDSPRCVGHLSHLVTGLRPYRRSHGVTQFIDRARPTLANIP